MVEAKRREVEQLESGTHKISDISKLDFKVGDLVHILTGSFAGNFGKVTDINLEKGSVSVETEFFGRKTEVPVAFNEVKRR